ncbi:MAG: phage tail sheath C-terminal domain-containing protein [Myxococcota bacterium]
MAEVSTAVPAFVGYTQKGGSYDQGPPITYIPQIAKISTMLEFEEIFGGPKIRGYSATTTGTGDDERLDALTREAPAAEPSFLLYHAVNLYFKNGGGPCYIATIGDYDTTVPAKAAFEAGLALIEQEDEPTLIVLTDAVDLPPADYHDLAQSALAQCAKLRDRFVILDVLDDADVTGFRDGIGTNDLMYGAAYHPHLQTSLSYPHDEASVTVGGDTLATIRSTKTALYSEIKLALAQQRITMPPSAAIAGVYASVDRDRGVWKAPANVSLASVVAPTLKISNDAQEGLNVDPTAGKSINAVRAFTGKGTLVWGARTLAGNDNEWRYVSTRRLFNQIEESTQKSTAFAVFEPNDETTWLKVRGMIESYLYRLWEQGALAGTSPEQAYYVNVGLGRTMTEQDVLEGRMNVEIGIAASRPAEFIVLKFTHKVQEA